MNRKPDVVRTVFILFVLGLAVSGITSLQASDDRQVTAPATSLVEKESLARWDAGADQ